MAVGENSSVACDTSAIRVPTIISVRTASGLAGYPHPISSSIRLKNTWLLWVSSISGQRIHCSCEYPVHPVKEYIAPVSIRYIRSKNTWLRWISGTADQKIHDSCEYPVHPVKEYMTAVSIRHIRSKNTWLLWVSGTSDQRIHNLCECTGHISTRNSWFWREVALSVEGMRVFFFLLEYSVFNKEYNLPIFNVDQFVAKRKWNSISKKRGTSLALFAL